MKVSQDQEYVSPLEEENSLNIRINVTNCKEEHYKSKKRGINFYIEPFDADPALFVVVDSRTNKILEVNLPRFKVRYDWKGYRDCKGREFKSIRDELPTWHNWPCSYDLDGPGSFFIEQGDCQKLTF